MPKFNYQAYLQKIQSSEDSVELLNLQKEIYAVYNRCNEEVKKKLGQQVNVLIFEIVQKLRKLNEG
ncbi:MAG: hypothetical protein MUE85_18175 [Microscillaceae bacterium]|jgi:hypothetical protein|nr:hypothetical protein [Microscillaceae bacterium]